MSKEQGRSQRGWGFDTFNFGKIMQFSLLFRGEGHLGLKIRNRSNRRK